MIPEFSRPVRLDTIGSVPRPQEVEANAAERAALVKRFGLAALPRLVATAALTRVAAGILVEGHVQAQVAQRCAATDVELEPAPINEPFRLLFAANAAESEDLELSAEDLDVLPLEGGAIDLGEIAAETLALALDPFPRAPDADATLREAGVKDEEEAAAERAANGPFGALAALKGKLGGD